MEDVMKHEPRTASARPDTERGGRGRLLLLIWTVPAVFVLASLMYGFNVKERGSTRIEMRKERLTMLSMTRKAETVSAIPPIDAAVPEVTETATFALG